MPGKRCGRVVFREEFHESVPRKRGENGAGPRSWQITLGGHKFAIFTVMHWNEGTQRNGTASAKKWTRRGMERPREPGKRDARYSMSEGGRVGGTITVSRTATDLPSFMCVCAPISWSTNEVGRSRTRPRELLHCELRQRARRLRLSHIHA